MKDDRVYLLHVQDAIHRIQSYVTGGRQGFHSDTKTQDAVVRNLTTCGSCAHLGTCTRCPGLAYMEGNMRGPSTQDCEKSYARTGIPTANMLARQAAVTRTPYCPNEAAIPG